MKEEWKTVGSGGYGGIAKMQGITYEVYIVDKFAMHARKRRLGGYSEMVSVRESSRTAFLFIAGVAWVARCIRGLCNLQCIISIQQGMNYRTALKSSCFLDTLQMMRQSLEKRSRK